MSGEENLSAPHPSKSDSDGADDPNAPRIEQREISLKEALEMGIRHHQMGRLNEAQHIYAKILQAVPAQPDALHFLGVVRHQLGDAEQAIDFLRQAIAAEPNHPDMRNNLGRVLKENDRLDEALEAFSEASRLAPQNPDVLNNLGTTYKALDRWEEAADSFQDAIRADATHADAHYNLGNVFRQAGKHDEAAHCFRRAIDLKPDAAHDYQNLCQCLWRAGRKDEARQAVREWQAYEPDNPVAAHIAAAFGMGDGATRASDEFVATHFDDHAESFDKHLKELDYRTPGEITKRVEDCLSGRKAKTILDAGCGTGLCGPALRPLADRLVGVDLSAKMIERAEDRGYDALEVAELTAYLQEHPAAYDAVISADTLVYFGGLEEVFQATVESLHPGGWFVFSVESLEKTKSEVPPDDPGFFLQFHGRYAHRKEYVEEQLAEAGFTEVQTAPSVLRMEVGDQVHGWIVQAQKPAH